MKANLLLNFFVFACTTRHSVEDAKAVIKSHEQLSKAGDLEGIMSNMADDVVFLAPGMPLMKGKDACRNFYTGMVKMGKTKFTHNYDGAEIIGDAVVLHGLATALQQCRMPALFILQTISSLPLNISRTVR